MNRKKRFRRRILLIFLAALCIALAFLIQCRYMPFVREAAITRVTNLASDRINDAIHAQIDSGEVNYERIIQLEKDVNGNITALLTNMAEVNRLKTLTMSLLCEQLLEMETEELSIPIGSILMPEFFAGKGPRLPVSVVSLSTTESDFFSSFTDAGINQTRQRIIFQARIVLVVLTPVGTQNVEVTSDVVVAETILLGKVPQSYIQIGNTNEEG